MDIQIVISAITVIGAGISAYVGVKVALAEVRVEQKAQGERIKDVETDVRRLEDALFFKKRDT